MIMIDFVGLRCRVHEDGQAFYCEHCGYVTSYFDSFQDHLNLHSEVISSFTCVACREPFSDLVTLQKHMKVRRLIIVAGFAGRSLCCEGGKQLYTACVPLSDADPHPLVCSVGLTCSRYYVSPACFMYVTLLFRIHARK